MLSKDVPNIKDDAMQTGGEARSADALDLKLGQLEQQFSLLNGQVRELQRLASLGTMSAVVAHEINNLLTPMISYGQFAVGQEDPTVWRKAVERSNRGAVRLRALCDGILGVASSTKSSPVVSPVRPILEETLHATGRDWRKDGIDATVEAAEGVTACFDPSAMRQVLFNLTINARQAMLGRGGRLRLSAGPMDGGRVQIRVSDTGEGIAAEHLPQIFEPFFTTKRDSDRMESGGVGLGLYVCRCLVEDQRGTIRVESQVGAGTTFLIELPATD